jgi:hypothetical protein
LINSGEFWSTVWSTLTGKVYSHRYIVMHALQKKSLFCQIKLTPNSVCVGLSTGYYKLFIFWD